MTAKKRCLSLNEESRAIMYPVFQEQSKLSAWLVNFFKKEPSEKEVEL